MTKQFDPPAPGSDREARLADQIREWHAFAKSARDWLWTCDAQGRFTYISEQFREICGESPDVYYGKTLDDVVLRYLDQEEADRILADIALRKPFRDLVFERRVADGRRLWMRASGVPSFDADGNFTGYRGAGSDLTEFVETWERRNRLARMLHSAPFGMMLVDQNMRIQLINAVLLDFIKTFLPSVTVGSTFEEFLRAGIVAGFVDTMGEEIDLYVARRVSEILTGPSVVERQHMGGSYEIRSHLLPDGSILFYFVDITEQKQMRERVMHAQRIEAMGHLTAGIAHDFNNLMEVILGSLELLRSDPKSEDAGDLIEMAMRATERGAQLTGQLLCFSGEATLSPRLVRPGDLIRKIEPRLRQALTPGVSMELELEDKLLCTWMDPRQFEAALTNLVRNACDAMPEGGRLTIAAANREGGMVCGEWPNAPAMSEAHVTVTIADTGAGMDTELREKALEPFFTTKEVGEGSGLGLSMVHGFVQQSSGKISLDSVEGEGTTVRLCFPGFEERRAAPAYGGLEPQSDEPGAAHILVVEDTDDVRHVIRRQLEREGYRVTEAVAGSEAMELLADDQSIDLMLSDVVMPGDLQGPELVRRARELRPDLRTVLMSGYPRSSVDQDDPLPEDTRLLAKPMSNRELLIAIAEILSQRPVATGRASGHVEDARPDKET